jgi:hypothetical protein
MCFCNFKCGYYVFEKNSKFLYPFYGGGDYGGGKQFCNIFPFYYYGKMIQLQTLQVSYGVLGKKYFLNRP